MSRTSHRHAPVAILFFLFLNLPCASMGATRQVELPLTSAWEGKDPAGAALAAVARDPGAALAQAPTLSWWWALDEGERIGGIELLVDEEFSLGALSAPPERAPLLSNEGMAARLPDGPLHAEHFRLRLAEPRTLHGRRFQSLTLSPLRLAEGQLRGLGKARIQLEIESDDRMPSLRPLRADFPLRARVLGSLGETLLNPEALPPAALRAVGGGGFPTDVPSVEGSAVEMVVVTVDSFADLCATYAAQRTADGVPTVVRSMSWIREHYPYGSDRSEVLRNFLRDAYAKWSLRYALLVGDSEQIPPRYAYSDIFSDGRTVPTDLYYACLDGDWNADHDHLWAEPLDEFYGIPGDEADLLAELKLGRLPAADRAECSVMLDKSLGYYQCTGGRYQDRMLLLGEVLFPLDYPTNPNIIMDGAEYCDSVYVYSTDYRHHVTRLYENTLDYPGSLPLSVSSALDSMAAGQNIVLHNGHGSRQSMSVANGSIDPSGVSHLDNGQRTFALYMINCTAAAFDFSCLAETFLENPNGGAHAVIGSTRETFASTSAAYSYVFFSDIYHLPELSIGELFVRMLNAFPDTEWDSAQRWATLTITLFADPSLWLHYAAADSITVVPPSDGGLDRAELVLSVATSDQSPLAGALVTFHKPGEDYQGVFTDAAGEARFTPKAATAGTYSYAVAARDIVPRSGSFTVSAPEAAPLLSLMSVSVDDFSDGTVIGNGNGIAERGETVRLLLELQNRGGGAALNVGAQLSCSHPAVSLLDATVQFGDLPPASAAMGGDPVLIQIGTGIADDAIFAFGLDINHDAGLAADDFFLESAAAALELYGTTISDDLIEIGEQAAVMIQLANRGRGSAQSLTAQATAPPGSGLGIVVGEDNLGNLAPLSTGLGPAAFTVEVLSADPPLLNLILTDLFAHADTFALDLSAPVGAPAPPSFEILQNVERMRLHWTPPAAGDVAAYALYRSSAAEGPYQRISADWIPSSTYEDQGLAPYTSYWYRLNGITASGLAGAWSDSAKVTTNPGLKRGWPASLRKETPSTPVIGDVDGDGAYEVIVGADLLYGFNDNGSELSDGDGDPITQGPVFGSGDNFFCSLAASDLTDSPGLEVVACSWNTAQVFVLEFTDTPSGAVASVAAGWPRTLPAGYGIWASPGLADVDGDGDLEIFVTDISGTMSAWHHNGVEVADGDGIPITQGVFATGLGGWTRATPGFADVDGDGDMEIFTGGGHGYCEGFQGDASDLPGFPVAVGGAVFSGTSIGDIDGDLTPEIAFVAEDDSIHVIDHDGRPLPGWPVHLWNDNWALAPSIALGDVDGDDKPELFVCGIHDYVTMEVGWLDGDGTWLPGWPLTAAFSSQSSPVVGDLDGDGDLETVLGNEFASIEAWHHDGSPVDGFPIVTGDYVRAVPSLMDLDRDGLLDMVLVGWDKQVYVWEFPVEHDPLLTPWYTFQHDQRRSGNAEQLDWVVAAEDASPTPPGFLRLEPNFPNPFNPVTRIRFRIGGAATAAVRLEIYDVQGRRRRVLLDETLAPGAYERNWSGRDDNGRGLASGLYFARLSVGDRTETRKMTLLK